MFDDEALSKMTDLERSKYYVEMQKALTLKKKALSNTLAETVDERQEQRGLGAQLKRDNKETRAELRDAIALTQTAFSRGDDDQILELAETVLACAKTYSNHIVAFVKNRHGNSEMARELVDCNIDTDNDTVNATVEDAGTDPVEDAESSTL